MPGASPAVSSRGKNGFSTQEGEGLQIGSTVCLEIRDPLPRLGLWKFLPRLVPLTKVIVYGLSLPEANYYVFKVIQLRELSFRKIVFFLTVLMDRR